MKAENFDLQAYFNRIGYGRYSVGDPATLREIMRCQLFSVPFENLDVQAGKVISLKPEEIFSKIVERKRGGYCYEVNGVFAMALGELGVPYRFVAARPMTYSVRRPRTHMAIVANMEGGEWLFDLGFGSYGIREPLDLGRLDRDIPQGASAFRLTRSAEGEYLLQRVCERKRSNLYEFNLSPQEWVDFEPANYLNSTHPDSIFVRSLMVVLQTPTGKKVLHGDRFRVVSEGGTVERSVGPDALLSLLEQEFLLDVRM